MGATGNKRFLRIVVFALTVLLGLAAAPAAVAENFVDWKGGFWFSMPDGWEKVDYKVVDRVLVTADTSREIFDYEGVFAPAGKKIFSSGGYFVVTYDSTGELTKRESDSILTTIGKTYSTDVFDAAVVEYMSDLVPGRPQVDLEKRTLSVLSEMAYRPEARTKMWLYLTLKNEGLLTFYFYSPDSLFERHKPLYDEVIASLSFEKLKEAAAGQSLTFTEVAGTAGLVDDEEAQAAEAVMNVRDWILGAVIVIIIFGLLWNFVIRPRLNKKTEPSEPSDS